MQVERYIFFPVCAERFGLLSPGLLAEGRDEDGEQGMLHSALQILEEASPMSPQALCSFRNQCKSSAPPMLEIGWPEGLPELSVQMLAAGKAFLDCKQRFARTVSTLSALWDAAAVQLGSCLPAGAQASLRGRLGSRQGCAGASPGSALQYFAGHAPGV